MGSAATEVETSTYLTKYFSCIIKHKPVDTDPNEIMQVITSDLDVNCDTLNPRLKEIIPYMFIHYVKHWPGWQKQTEYEQGLLTYQDWFARFKQYLCIKLVNLIRTKFDPVMHAYQKEELSSKISEISPVQIKITGPPSLLNSIIFVNIGDDAVIKRHMGPRVNSISIEQIMNWPFLQIEFTTIEFCFIRHSFLCVERYLSGTNEKIKFPNSPYIEQAENVAPQLPRQVVTGELLDYYMKRCFEHIEQTYADYVLPKHVSFALEQFLMDVGELEMENTIATNTLVTFNIGKCKYVRSKKVKASPNQDDPVIKYFEVITPKVSVTIKYFKAVPFRKAKDDLDFVLFTNDKCKSPQLIPTLKFTCTFCNVSMATAAEVSKHFCQDHGMEQLLYCLRCHRKYEVPQLVLSRWKHECLNP